MHYSQHTSDYFPNSTCRAHAAASCLTILLERPITPKQIIDAILEAGPEYIDRLADMYRVWKPKRLDRWHWAYLHIHELLGLDNITAEKAQLDPEGVIAALESGAILYVATDFSGRNHYQTKGHGHPVTVYGYDAKQDAFNVHCSWGNPLTRYRDHKLNRWQYTEWDGNSLVIPSIFPGWEWPANSIIYRKIHA